MEPSGGHFVRSDTFNMPNVGPRIEARGQEGRDHVMGERGRSQSRQADQYRQNYPPNSVPPPQRRTQTSHGAPPTIPRDTMSHANLGFPTSSTQPSSGAPRIRPSNNGPPLPFKDHGPRSYQVPHQGQQQQHPVHPTPTARPPPPPVTPRARAQSQTYHQAPSFDRDEDAQDIVTASRMRAKTPVGTRTQPSPVRRTPAKAHQDLPPAPSSSEPGTPSHNEPYTSPKYYADRPITVRPLSPSPPPESFLPGPPPPLVSERPLYHSRAPQSRPPSRARQSQIQPEMFAEPVLPTHRRSSSVSANRGGYDTPMPPHKTFVESAIEQEEAKRKADEELAQCKMDILELQARLEASEETSDMHERDVNTCKDIISSLRTSKEVTIASATKKIESLKANIVKIDNNFQEVQEAAQTPATILADIEHLKAESADIVKSAFGPVSSDDGDENQENNEVLGGETPYHILLGKHAVVIQRARDAAAIAKEATAELLDVEKQCKSLRTENQALDHQLKKEQFSTKRVRDLEQTLAETIRKWREDEESSRKRYQELQEQQHKSLPEREVATAARLVAESECREVKKELVVVTKNLQSLREEHDQSQERFDLGVTLLRRVGVLDPEGEIDEQALLDLEGQEERHEAELGEMRGSLDAAKKEISSLHAKITELNDQAEMTTSQRIAAEAAGVERDQEAVIALQGEVAELKKKLKEAEEKVVEAQQAHDGDDLEMAMQLQAMQDREKEKDALLAASETRLKDAVQAQSNTVKGLEKDLAAAESELEQLRTELAKPKASSPGISEAERATYKAELQAEKVTLIQTIETKDSDLAAADEGEAERKDAIENLVKARDRLEADLAEARDYIRDMPSTSSDKSKQKGGKGSDLEIENRELKDNIATLRNMMLARHGEVKKRYDTDSLTTEEEEAIRIALEKTNYTRAIELDALNKKLRLCSELFRANQSEDTADESDDKIQKFEESETRLRKEIKAMRSDPSRSERRSSDLTTPPRSDDAGPAKTPAGSSSRSSASTSKKSDTGRNAKKARFDDEAINNKAGSSKNTPSSTNVAIAKISNGKLRPINLQDHQAPDPISQFSSQMDDREVDAGPSGAGPRTGGRKRRNMDISDDESAEVAALAKSPSTSKTATSKANKKSNAKAKAIRPTGTSLFPSQRQTRAASRQPSDASTAITSTPLPIPTQNPNKLRCKGGIKEAAVEEEEDELDDDDE